MNLLYLCDEYPPCQHGGIGSVTQNLARELVLKGHQVTICGFYPYYRTALPFEDDFGVKVFRRFYGNRILLKLSRHKILGRIVNIERKFNLYIIFLKELIKKNKIDIIEIPDFNEAFRYSGPRFIEYPDFKITKIIKLHGSYSYLDHSKKEWSFNKDIYQKEKNHIYSATKVVAVSNFAKRVTKDIFEYKKDIAVIHNGISAKYQINYKGDSGKNTVIFAGRLSEEKGVLSLISAWEEVVNHFPSAKLLLYGKGDYKTIEKIKNLYSEKTQGSIEIKGFVSHKVLFEVYSTASCAIFPSYFESFGMAPMEAMQTGCPTIYTKRSSGEELITHKVNGLLIDPDNTNEIADAIIYMLTNRTAAKTMGENGKITILGKFNISSSVEMHVEFYSGLIMDGK